MPNQSISAETVRDARAVTVGVLAQTGRDIEEHGAGARLVRWARLLAALGEPGDPHKPDGLDPDDIEEVYVVAALRLRDAVMLANNELAAARAEGPHGHEAAREHRARAQWSHAEGTRARRVLQDLNTNGGGEGA